ncbi:GTP pyrophosphokinase [Haliangium sp.]|uniref:GTP pyrophosphokinase n=1 Tax=Haliangium sp. TaxID=2663208 RepID=UPI003D0ABB2B
MQIEALVKSYTLQMTRYEEAALLVEQRLRRELRAAALRALLSSRAKHPEDLREKLRRKRQDSRYVFALLDRDLNRTVTDLAGCRVVVYHPTDERLVEQVVSRSFPPAPGDNSHERHRKGSGYRATHLLVSIPDGERESLRGAICEVQITSIASHVFNELEHDILYKDQSVPPGDTVGACVEDLHHAARLLDRVVERLLDSRAEEIHKQQKALEDPEQLRYALERIAGQPLLGDFARLFQLLQCVEPLTVSALEELGSRDWWAQGKEVAEQLGLEQTDDVIHLVLALSEQFAEEFVAVAQTWRGPTTPLKRAILSMSNQGTETNDSPHANPS